MPDRDTRLRFYGLGDYGTFFQVERAMRLLNEFDATRTDYNVDDVIELHHAAVFAEHDLFPQSMPETERANCRAEIGGIRRAVGIFFGSIDNDNVGALIRDVDFQYRVDVLEQMARAKVYDRCSANAVLNALTAANISCGDLLSCRPLVKAYDHEMRTLLLGSPHNAEHLVAKHLGSDTTHAIHLPTSFTPADSRSLLAAYVDDQDANPNFVRLIATARADIGTGIDAKLKLQAKRAQDAFTQKHFETHEGIKTGCEVVVSDDQDKAVVESMDDMVGKYSYSRQWLQETLDYPSVLNNFVHLFNFADRNMLLLLPSHVADLGVFERHIFTVGRNNYLTGAVFDHQSTASFLQTVMYRQFLQTDGIEIEEVIAWFFTEYLRAEFGAEHLRFKPSSAAATYLEKSRHLFSEMESVMKQFSLYVENGELDLALLSVTSEQLVYGQIPSRVVGKYAYVVSDQSDIARVQHMLFSDQSRMNYINEELRADSFARLIVAHHVGYDDFADYQKPGLDALLSDGIVKDDAGRIRFADAAQFRVLHELNAFEAASYFHQSEAGQRAIDAMVARGWLERRGTLLTSAERSYVNFFLNQVEFSDGPDLRNRYLHGSQADGEDDRVHFQTYIVALRLLIALVIKVNDDFEIHATQCDTSTEPDSSGTAGTA